MKKLLILLVILAPALTYAQKEVKPSLAKAEKALKDFKLDQAKAIIDVTTTSPDVMVDKKGQPSKNAARAWYLKGLIYAAIDTTKKEEFKSLDPNPFPTVKESFDKSMELDGGKTKYFVLDGMGIPLLNENITQYLAQAYFNKAIVEYQERKNYKKAFELTENTLYFIPNDTSVLMNAGVYFGPAAEDFEKSEVYMKRYIANGGKSVDPYIMLFSIYRDKKKDLDGALALAQEAMAKFPNNTEFPKYELDIFIKQNKLPQAKEAMQKQAMADPNDKESRYFLGVICMELKNFKEARTWFDEALKIDPKYFEANLALAEVVYQDAKDVKAEMNHLGITADDKKKRFELDKVYVEKLKVALPYFENCEKLSPDDAKVLDNLLSIYTDLDVQPQIKRVEAKMKKLGLLD